MNVLITGVNGLIGAEVASQLAFDNAIYRLGRQKEFVDSVIDLTDIDTILNSVIPTSGCLVHCAGVVDEDFKTDSIAAYQKATIGAEALLKKAISVGVKKFIYISSTHVYGAQIGKITELSPVNPQTHYALAHYCTEQLFKKYADGCGGNVVILRPNAVYGMPKFINTFQRWSLIPFSFPDEAKKYGKITLKSSGLQRRNFVSISAIARLITRCVNGDLQGTQGIINVLGANTESVYEFASRCKKVTEEAMNRSCIVERSEVYLAQANASAGSDFELFSNINQPVVSDELNSFLRNLLNYKN
jgi:UDP-glucose 4-epimerase